MGPRVGLNAVEKRKIFSLYEIIDQPHTSQMTYASDSYDKKLHFPGNPSADHAVVLYI
jgi:hypothetical protein